MRAIGLEIGSGHRARTRLLARTCGDFRGNRSFEQRARPFGRDRAQRLCVLGIAQRVTGLHRRTVGSREKSAGVRCACLRELAVRESGQPLRHDEALVSCPSRRVEQFAPGQAAEAFVGKAEHCDCSRRTGRTATRDRVGIRERLAVLADEHVRRRACRRCLPSVECREPAGPAVEVQEERSAAQPRALRLHETQRSLHSDRSVDR